jgi:hypothetical protein
VHRTEDELRVCDPDTDDIRADNAARILREMSADLEWPNEPLDDEFARQIRVAQEVLRKNRAILKALAKAP